MRAEMAKLPHATTRREVQGQPHRGVRDSQRAQAQLLPLLPQGHAKAKVALQATLHATLHATVQATLHATLQATVQTPLNATLQATLRLQ